MNVDQCRDIFQSKRWIGRSAGDAENLAADGCVELTSSKGLLDPPKEED